MGTLNESSSMNKNMTKFILNIYHHFISISVNFVSPIVILTIVIVWSQFDGGKIDNRTIGLWFLPKPRRSQARDYGEENIDQ